MVMTNRQQLHDALLEQMPEGASHDAAVCSVCVATSSGAPEGGKVDTYTAEDLQAAVADATAELNARIAAMEAAATESAMDARLAAVKAEADAQIADVRTQLDTAVLEAGQAKGELVAFRDGLTALAEAEALNVAVAARKETRLARVKESASFPDEYLASNADRFAAMSDEDFEERVAEWASLSAKTAPLAGGIPRQTALVAAREITDTTARGALREVMRDFRSQHIDPRSL